MVVKPRTKSFEYCRFLLPVILLSVSVNNSKTIQNFTQGGDHPCLGPPQRGSECGSYKSSVVYVITTHGPGFVHTEA